MCQKWEDNTFDTSFLFSWFEWLGRLALHQLEKDCKTLSAGSSLPLMALPNIDVNNIIMVMFYLFYY